MSDTEDVNPDPVVERAAELIRSRAYTRPAARHELIERLAGRARSGAAQAPRSRRYVGWSVLAGGMLAAGVAITVIERRAHSAPIGAIALAEGGPAATHLVHFSVDAPDAQRVMLVGEFNDWSDSATPMERSASGQWTASLALESGRHLYSFDVGAGRLIPDPSAPSAPEEFFGVRHSVVVVP